MSNKPRGVKVSFEFSNTKLRSARQRAEKTQLELALNAGVSLASVRRAEHGYMVSLEVASSIGAALNLDFKTLLREDSDASAHEGLPARAYATRTLVADSSFVADAYAMSRFNMLNQDDIAVLIRILTVSTPEDDQDLPIRERRISLKIPVFNGMPLVKDLDKLGSFFLSRSEIDTLVEERIDAKDIFDKLENLGFIEWESQPIPYDHKGKLKKYFSDEKLLNSYLYHAKIGTVGLKSLGSRLLESLNDVQDVLPRGIAGLPDGEFLYEL